MAEEKFERKIDNDSETHQLWPKILFINPKYYCVECDRVPNIVYGCGLHVLCKKCADKCLNNGNVCPKHGCEYVIQNVDGIAKRVVAESQENIGKQMMKCPSNMDNMKRNNKNANGDVGNDEGVVANTRYNNGFANHCKDKIQMRNVTEHIKTCVYYNANVILPKVQKELNDMKKNVDRFSHVSDEIVKVRDDVTKNRNGINNELENVKDSIQVNSAIINGKKNTFIVTIICVVCFCIVIGLGIIYNRQCNEFERIKLIEQKINDTFGGYVAHVEYEALKEQIELMKTNISDIINQNNELSNAISKYKTDILLLTETIDNITANQTCIIDVGNEYDTKYDSINLKWTNYTDEIHWVSDDLRNVSVLKTKDGWFRTYPASKLQNDTLIQLECNFTDQPHHEFIGVTNNNTWIEHGIYGENGLIFNNKIQSNTEWYKGIPNKDEPINISIFITFMEPDIGISFYFDDIFIGEPNSEYTFIENATNFDEFILDVRLLNKGSWCAIKN
mmetsp:Transcript_64162/g.78454  ORF Transcript_64162/g.78454 Transcript_64162/m.78454 type:complete len:504 (+) Transcript_64162:676-2187(+)